MSYKILSFCKNELFSNIAREKSFRVFLRTP